MSITLTNDYMKRQMAAAVPGAYYDGSAWVLDEPTPRAAAVVLKLFPDVGQRHTELLALRDELLVDVRPFDNATPFNRRIVAPRTEARVHEQWSCTADECRTHIDSASKPLCPQHGDTMKHWELFPYQAVDLGYGKAVLEQHGGLYIGWERGLGKTLATCLLIDAFDVQRGLIVAPNTAKYDPWERDLATFCPWVEVVVMPNQKAKRERVLRYVQQRFQTPGGKPLVFVAHYESLALVAGVSYKRKGKPSLWGYDKWPAHMKPSLLPAERNALDDEERKCYRKVLGNGWDKFISNELMVADEVHRLANPDAQMTRAAKKVPAAMRVGLSGSIIQNHMEELYSPLNWKFPKNYSSKWRDWNDRFLDFIDGGFGKICLGVKPEMVEPLRAELGTFMVYRRKEDELPGLPARSDVDRRVELSPAQRRAYDQLVATCMTRLEDGTTIKADEGAGMMTKLRQIATGLDGLGNVTDSSKLDLAVELITDAEDDDFVVFSWYKAPVYALAERLIKRKIEPFIVTGDIKSQVRRNEAIARFQAGEGRVFIGTLSTLGESVNLQRANNVIMLDRSWNPALNSQAEDRVYRQGQRRKTTITHIIAKDTVDELNVLPTLANKQALRAAILGGI